MNRQKTPLTPTATRTLRRLAEGTGVLVGLWACIATSPAEEPWLDEPLFEDFTAEVYVHNATADMLLVSARPLRVDVEVDCGEVRSDVGRLLPDAAFGEAVQWQVPSGANVPALEGSTTRDCNAVRLEGPGIEPTIVFWYAGSPASQWVPGQHFDPAELGSNGVMLDYDDEGLVAAAGGVPLQVEPVASAPEVSLECTLPSDGDRIDWAGVPQATLAIDAVELGLDGCHRIVGTPLGEDWEEEPEPQDFYLCVPADAVWFEQGDLVRFDRSGEGSGQGILTAEDLGNPARSLVASYGSTPTFSDVDIHFREKFNCAPTLDDACATVARPAEVVASSADEVVAIESGASGSLTDAEGNHIEVFVATAQSRLVLESACSEGADAVGRDLGVVVVHHGAP